MGLKETVSKYKLQDTTFKQYSYHTKLIREISSLVRGQDYNVQHNFNYNNFISFNRNLRCYMKNSTCNQILNAG